VRAIAGEQSCNGTSTETTEELDDCVPEPLQRRLNRGTERGSPLCLGAELPLPSIQGARRRAPHRQDGDDTMRKAPVAGVERWIEHIRQSRTKIAGHEATQQLEGHALS
jgi:hypothetical protein